MTPVVNSTTSKDSAGSSRPTRTASRSDDRSAATKLSRAAGSSRNVPPTTVPPAPRAKACCAMARPRPLVPPTTASLFDERSSRSIGIGRTVTLGSVTPLMEVFCFRGVWESLTVEFLDAFTDVSFLMCIRAGGASFDELACVDGERDAGDVAGFVGGEEQHGVGDVHRVEPGDGKRVERLEYRFDFLAGDVAGVVGQELVVERLGVEHVGVDRAGVHRV